MKIPGFTHHAAKGSSQELLPSRSALSTLSRGQQGDRSMNRYAKMTPSGAGALTAPSVLGMSPPGNDGVNG